MKLRLAALFAVCLVAATCASASKPRMTKSVSPAADRILNGRRALLDDGEGAPICSLPTVEPTVVQPSCPEGGDAGQDADGVYHCYAACSELDTKRVVYTPSEDGAKCIPSCPAGQVVASTTDDGVVCASCPFGFTYVEAKGTCFQACKGDTPVSYDLLSPPRCAANCPKGFPLQRSFNRCANRAGRTITRVNIVRTSVQATKRSLAAVDRPVEDASCPDSSTPLEDDNGVTSCYTCPENESLTQDGAGYATCAPDTCPEGYKKCGAYCWNDFLSDGLDFWQDDYCAAFMDSVAGCVPGCDAAFGRRS